MTKRSVLEEAASLLQRSGKQGPQEFMIEPMRDSARLDRIA